MNAGRTTLRPPTAGTPLPTIRRTVNELRRFRESEQGLTGLVSLIGFPTGRVPVTSGSRKAGRTKYSFTRQINLAIGFILSFSTKPLRVASILGLAVLSLSLLYVAVVVVVRSIWLLTVTSLCSSEVVSSPPLPHAATRRAA